MGLRSDLHSDGSHSRSTSSVWDAEGLVKVQVRDISTVVSRTTETNLSIHVSSININLRKVRKTWSLSAPPGYKSQIYDKIHEYMLTKFMSVCVSVCLNYLSPVLVDVVTDLSNAILKDSAGRRVSDHHCSKVIPVLLNLKQ